MASTAQERGEESLGRAGVGGPVEGFMAATRGQSGNDGQHPQSISSSRKGRGGLDSTAQLVTTRLLSRSIQESLAIRPRVLETRRTDDEKIDRRPSLIIIMEEG